jgi:hypothetical protein
MDCPPACAHDTLSLIDRSTTRSAGRRESAAGAIRRRATRSGGRMLAACANVAGAKAASGAKAAAVAEAAADA